MFRAEISFRKNIRKIISPNEIRDTKFYICPYEKQRYENLCRIFLPDMLSVEAVAVSWMDGKNCGSTTCCDTI